MRSSTYPTPAIEKMLLLRLIQRVIPGFAAVEKQTEALMAKCDAHNVVSVAQNARVSLVDFFSILFLPFRHCSSFIFLRNRGK